MLLGLEAERLMVVDHFTKLSANFHSVVLQELGLIACQVFARLRCTDPVNSFLKFTVRVG